jgi:hypothetical protein
MLHRRTSWRILKWLGTAACVLLVTAYVATAWRWYAAVRIDRGDVILTLNLVGGATEAMLITSSAAAPATLRTQLEMERLGSVRFIWYPRYAAGGIEGGPPGTYVRRLIVPLWLLFALLAIPTLLLWRCDRRRIPLHCCHKCGYDLTGNVTGRCPECGTPVASKRGHSTFSKK